MHSQHHVHRKCTVGAVLLLVLGRIALAQIGLGLSPMRLELKMDPGMRHSGILALDSDSHTTVRTRAEVLDFFIDQNQTPQFEPRLRSESEFSCREWVTVNPMETEIEPGKQVAVRYTIRVPSDAVSSRGYHCAIGFTTLPTADQVGGTGIRTAVQVISALYVTAGNPGIEGQFTHLGLVRRASERETHWVGEVVLQNFGLTHFRPIGELSIIDTNGTVLESVAFTPLPALPKREQRYFVQFSRDLAPGAYTLRARADFGGAAVEELITTVRAE